MDKGIIIKGIGGFYYVQRINSDIVECKARGIFRKDKITPMVGDEVLITIIDDGQGIIEDILPRKNQLIRPPVTNIDQAIIVFSLLNPNPNFQLIDRFLVQGEKQNLSLIICINKIDIVSNIKSKEEEIQDMYKNTGYPIIFTSVKENIGIEDLTKNLENHITVFAGPSGVGKSSLLNKINTDYNLETGIISSKISRGRHTTRHVELLSYGINGHVVDTPGFSSLSMDNIKEEELMYFFPEFNKYIGKCKFNSCIHIHEPNCAIIDALHEGKIKESRYKNYNYFMTEIKNNREY
jgi:ribosome biogenesis GTPase